jgi:hypothetical protein
VGALHRDAMEVLVLSQICIFEAKCENRMSKNQ